MLEQIQSITKKERQILTSEEVMDWLFSEGVKQADELFKQIVPIATMCGYLTIFKKEFLQRRLRKVREEYSLDDCRELSIYGYPTYRIPPEYNITEKDGIQKFNSDTLEYETVFPHPIIISERFQNIQTDEHLVKILYNDNSDVKSLIVDSYQVANTQAINTLSRKGIRVTSENAKFLIKFLSAFVSCNIYDIPLNKSTSVLGWTDDDKFLPYSDNVEFDGGDYAKTIFKNIKQSGDFKQWKKKVGDSLKNDYMRIYMATSFASPLLKHTGKQSFITHLWGKTETSKTVALYVAMSAWGNPKPITCQWNSTVVAAEQTAILLNDIPMTMNEAELLNDAKNGFHSYQEFIYMFCEGKSKPRGSKDGGLQVGGEWRSACLSNGEGSLITHNSKEGELNRVLEFLTDDKIFGDDEKAIEIVDFVKKNHGHAGELFVHKCTEYPLRDMWTKIFDIVKPHSTGKQAGQMSSLLLGDWMMQVIIWGADKNKAFDSTIEFFSRVKHCLKSKEDLDIIERCKEFLESWVMSNYNYFITPSKAENPHGEIFGEIVDNYAYIINSKFEQILSKNHYNLGKIKKEFKNRNIFKHMSDGKVTCVKRIKDFKVVRCYCIELPNDAEIEKDILNI